MKLKLEIFLQQRIHIFPRSVDSYKDLSMDEGFLKGLNKDRQMFLSSTLN